MILPRKGRSKRSEDLFGNSKQEAFWASCLPKGPYFIGGGAGISPTGLISGKKADGRAATHRGREAENRLFARQLIYGYRGRKNGISLSKKKAAKAEMLYRKWSANLQHVQVRQKCSVGRTEAHRGKSQNPVAWTAGREETNCLESVDKAIERVVSE